MFLITNKKTERKNAYSLQAIKRDNHIVRMSGNISHESASAKLESLWNECALVGNEFDIHGGHLSRVESFVV